MKVSNLAVMLPQKSFMNKIKAKFMSSFRLYAFIRSTLILFLKKLLINFAFILFIKDFLGSMRARLLTFITFIICNMSLATVLKTG